MVGWWWEDGGHHPFPGTNSFICQLPWLEGAAGCISLCLHPFSITSHGSIPRCQCCSPGPAFV